MNTELRFRFALNYASFFTPADRQTKFAEAQAIYDLRSKVAHGSKVTQKVKVADRNLTIREVAQLAQESLRFTIAKHLESSGSRLDSENWKSVFYPAEMDEQGEC